MKIETHKGIVIYLDSKTKEYYTEVVIRKKSPRKSQYTRSKQITAVRLEIDRFLASLGKTHPKVWVRGYFEHSKYRHVELIFQDKVAKIITVRDKSGRISTIAISDYIYDEPRVLANTAYNKKTIAAMEKAQTDLESLRKERFRMKLTLTRFESKSLK
mgnify:CR=1 FL=1